MFQNIPRCNHLLNLLVTPLFCLLTVAVVYVGAESEGLGQVKNAANDLAKFQKELKKRVSKDQTVRIALINQHKRKRKNSDQEAYNKRRKKLLKKASDTDGQNLEWLKGEIIRHGGIPKYPVLGVRSAEHFFLLVLHADRDPKFQLSFLDVFKTDTSQWPKSYAQSLERRLKLVSPKVLKERAKEQADDTPRIEKPKEPTELSNAN